MPSSTQLAAQLAQILSNSVKEGLWMFVVLMWGVFVAAWPAWIILGLLMVAVNRIRR